MQAGFHDSTGSRPVGRRIVIERCSFHSISKMQVGSHGTSLRWWRRKSRKLLLWLLLRCWRRARGCGWTQLCRRNRFRCLGFRGSLRTLLLLLSGGGSGGGLGRCCFARETGHPLGQVQAALLKVFVEVSSRVATSVVTHKAPAMQFPGEGRLLGLLEFLRQHQGSKQLGLADRKGLSRGHPRNGMGIFLVRQDFHQLKERERERERTTTRQEGETAWRNSRHPV